MVCDCSGRCFWRTRFFVDVNCFCPVSQSLRFFCSLLLGLHCRSKTATLSLIIPGTVRKSDLHANPFTRTSIHGFHWSCKRCTVNPTHRIQMTSLVGHNGHFTTTTAAGGFCLSRRGSGSLVQNRCDQPPRPRGSSGDLSSSLTVQRKRGSVRQRGPRVFSVSASLVLLLTDYDLRVCGHVLFFYVW